MTNQKINYTHEVPENEFGIFSMHCKDNVFITSEEYKLLFGEPMKRLNEEIEKEIKKEINI